MQVVCETDGVMMTMKDVRDVASGNVLVFENDVNMCVWCECVCV